MRAVHSWKFTVPIFKFINLHQLKVWDDVVRKFLYCDLNRLRWTVVKFTAMVVQRQTEAQSDASRASSCLSWLEHKNHARFVPGSSPNLPTNFYQSLSLLSSVYQLQSKHINNLQGNLKCSLCFLTCPGLYYKPTLVLLHRDRLKTYVFYLQFSCGLNSTLYILAG